MRPVSLFVHSPVVASLDPGIAALEHGDLYSVHEVTIDEELFPLLVEAKPCVLIASVESIMSSAGVFNLLKEFKEYRVKHKGASRDPGLRIVIVSEGKMPRLNWASLGVYEVIIGPVQPNVLTYKLNRHYHKAITAPEPEPDEQKDLVKEVELKQANSTPEWKVFTNPPAEKIETKVFKSNTEEIEQLSLRVHIADLNPERGEWRKSAVQTDPPPEWNWEFVEEDQQHGKLTWSFRGDEPSFHADDQTWQFSSAAPKLLRLNSQTDEVHTEFEYQPKSQEQEEARLRVKPELDLRSVRKQVYQKPIWRDEQRVEGPSADLNSEMNQRAKHLDKPQQDFGARPRGQEVDGFTDPYGKRPGNTHDDGFERIDPAAKGKDRAKPNYGNAPVAGESGDDLLSSENTSHSKNAALPSYGSAPRPDNLAFEIPETAKVRSPEPSTDLAKEPELDETFEFDQGIIRPKTDKKILSKNSPKAIAARQESLKKAQAHYSEFRQYDDEAAIIDAAAKKGALNKPGLQPLSALRPQEDTGEAVDYGHLNEKSEHDTRAQFADEDQTTELHSAQRERAEEGDVRKKFAAASSNTANDKRIENDEVNGSLSILYEDDASTKKNTIAKEAASETKNENAFDPSRWNFRLVRRAQTLSAKGLRKIPLAPQKKLSATEKSSLINRIIRFMIELFTRIAR